MSCLFFCSKLCRSRRSSWELRIWLKNFTGMSAVFRVFPMCPLASARVSQGLPTPWHLAFSYVCMFYSCRMHNLVTVLRWLSSCLLHTDFWKSPLMVMVLWQGKGLQPHWNTSLWGNQKTRMVAETVAFRCCFKCYLLLPKDHCHMMTI